MWRSWVIGALGIWIVVVPFIFYAGSTQKAVLVLSGILIALFAFSKLASEYRKETGEETAEEVMAEDVHTQ